MKISRREYLVRAVEFAPRGAALPQTKLTAADVRAIREMAQARAALRRQASEMSNVAIAARFGVHPRTIEKVLSYARIA